MKIKQTGVIIAAVCLMALGVVMPATAAFAVPAVQIAPEEGGNISTGGGGTSTCGDVSTAIISCNAPNDKKPATLRESSIWQILILTLNIMMAGVGILATAGIVYGAVLYASAADNAGQVAKAKTIIFNVVLGLIAFGLMYTLLNFLIPGGVFA